MYLAEIPLLLGPIEEQEIEISLFYWTHKKTGAEATSET
jgi:hypothetical protein